MVKQVGPLSHSVEDFPSLALLRVSTSAQALVQYGSLEQQKLSIIKKVEETSRKTSKKYYIIEFIEEDISGKFQNTKNRKDLKRIEQMIRSGKAKALFVDRADRLSRDLEFNVYFTRYMLETKAEYHEVENGQIDFSQEHQYHGFIHRSYQAERYSTELSKTVRTQGRRSRINNGKDSSTCPVFGLDAHGTLTCMYVRNEKEIEDLHKLGWHLIDSQDAVATAAYGNELGIRTKERWTKEKIDKDGRRIPPRKVGGELLTGRKLISMFTSPKIKGKGRFRDDLNQYPEKQDSDGYVEFDYAHGSIIEPKLQAELDKFFNENKKHYSYNDDYLFTGFIFSEDGRTYSGGSSLKKKSTGYSKYNYYLSKTKFKNIKRIQQKVIETEVINRLKHYMEDSTEFRNLLDTSNSLQDKISFNYQNLILESKAKISRLESDIAKFSEKIRELVLLESIDFHDSLKILSSEQGRIKKDLEDENAKLLLLKTEHTQICDKIDDKSFQRNLKLFFKGFDQLNNCDKKELLQILIPKITVMSDLRVVIHIDPSFSDQSSKIRHGSGQVRREFKNWRERRDSNPRPSA